MKSLLKIIIQFFSGYLSVIASLSSIIGLFIVLLSDQNKTTIALVSIIFFLLLILLRVHFFLDSFLVQNTEHGYHKFATYVRYSTEDANLINYELYKYIQCKCMILDEYKHQYYWSGSNKPTISSNLQSYERSQPDGNGYEVANFKFKKPLLLNEFGIVHIKMQIDDTNRASGTFVEQQIKDNIQLLNFRIELRYLQQNPVARIKRKKQNSPQPYDQIDTVPFDSSSKTYEYTLLVPEVGYVYRIDWDR